MPIAIVGMAVRHPGVETLAGYWQSLVEARPAPSVPLTEHWPNLAAGTAPPRSLADARLCLLEDAEVDVARYHIPPIQARGLARIQLLLLRLAEDALLDSGWPERRGAPERTDVICGTCFGFDRTFLNARRVEAARVIERYVAEVGRPADEARALRKALRRHLNRNLKASAYDRVGEMASTIPSRVSMHFGLRGRSLAVEAADATAFVALETAMTQLRAGLCDMALVMVGQRIESAATSAMLGLKGLVGSHRRPFTESDRGVMLGEGAGAIVLRRLDDARRDDHRIYATIEGIGQAQTPRAGTLRYSTDLSDRAAAVKAAWSEVDADLNTLAFVECFGSGITGEQSAELGGLSSALDARRAAVPVGSVKALLGHTFAYSGLAGLIKCALALHHRQLPPEPHSGHIPAAVAPLVWSDARIDLPASARLGVNGASLTGSAWHVVLSRAATASSPIVAVEDARAMPIAVVAADGMFAGAADAEAFWRNNVDGVDRVGPLPADAFERAVYHSPTGLDPLGSYTDIGASMTVPARPPPGVRMVPRRWLEMDPAQRVLLTVAARVFASLESAGRPTGRGMIAVASNLSLGRERGLDTRLTLASIGDILRGAPDMDPDALREALDAIAATLPAPSPWSFDTTLASASAAHIAHHFGLAAIPLAVEAACASSLAAFDMAVRGLRSRRYDYALAGGVELACNPRDMVLCSALGLLSRTRISPFCARADGFSPGDGAALFLLERLEDARAAERPIMAIIRGVGSASDARSLVAPDVFGQALAMRRAFDQVDFEPDGVQYVETHGTGTALGDQVEVLSTALVYCATRRSRPLALSSVKSMIGHTFAAAGSAGLLRTILALQHRTLPPTVGLGHLNPRLSLPALPARLITRSEPWTAPSGHPRRAGISAFGTGGIDYHLLLEEAR